MSNQWRLLIYLIYLFIWFILNWSLIPDPWSLILDPWSLIRWSLILFFKETLSKTTSNSILSISSYPILIVLFPGSKRTITILLTKYSLRNYCPLTLENFILLGPGFLLRGWSTAQALWCEIFETRWRTQREGQATKYRNGSDLWLDDKNGKS